MQVKKLQKAEVNQNTKKLQSKVRIARKTNSAKRQLGRRNINRQIITKLPSRTQATKTTKRNLKFKNSRLRRKK